MDEERSWGEFYLVREEILSEAIRKTIKVKEMLKRGDVHTINEAVERVDLSRSAYYKYKDAVFPFYEASQGKKVTFAFMLDHRRGVLGGVLNLISRGAGNVLTINQGIPLQGIANVTISIETLNMSTPLRDLMDELRMLDGVRSLEVLGQE